LNTGGSVTRTERAEICAFQQRPVEKAFEHIASWKPKPDESLTVGAFFGYVFCDWLTIHQDHPGGDLPIINDGFVVKFGAGSFGKSLDPETGEIRPVFDAMKAEFTTQRRIEHEGSYDTAVHVRCDGYRVELSGNVGRFGRPDNLFGERVLECVQRASEIVAALGLPAFTDSASSVGFARCDAFTKSNAVITRVDLTCNFATGSREAAYKVIQSTAGQGTRRGGKAAKCYPNGLTWNEGSKRHYEKLYYKGAELGAHVTEQVKAFCEDNGILRYEVSLKSRELEDRGLKRVTAWSRMEWGCRMDNVIFGKFAEVLDRQPVSIADLRDIPGKLGMIAQQYLDGHDPFRSASVAQRTRQVWRKQLLEHGIDIARPMNVQQFTHRVKMVEMAPMALPAWYSVSAA